MRSLKQKSLENYFQSKGKEASDGKEASESHLNRMKRENFFLEENVA